VSLIVHGLFLWLSPNPKIMPSGKISFGVLNFVPKNDGTKKESPVKPSAPNRSISKPFVHHAPTEPPPPLARNEEQAGGITEAPAPEGPHGPPGPPAPTPTSPKPGDVNLFDPNALYGTVQRWKGSQESKDQYIDPGAEGDGNSPAAEKARITGRLNGIANETAQEGRVNGGLISSCNDGIDQGLDGFMDCADPGCRLLPACANTKEFKNYVPKVIPDDDVRGITAEVNVNDEDDGKIRALTMQINVQHSSPGDLAVEVEHNGVKQVVIKADRSNRFWAKAYLLDKFIGGDARGKWTLRIRDVMPGHEGKFLNWTLYVTREEK
jgi:hypothetical protein